jgi:hypothetical protein
MQNAWHSGQISLGGTKKAEFSKIFILNAKFLEVSRQNLLGAEVPNRYFGSRVPTHAELNEIVQYLNIGFPPVTSIAAITDARSTDISFVNDLNPGVFWPKYDEGSPIALWLQEGNIGPIVDMLRREQINQVDVLEEFGCFG